jgi:hypothetical protein
VCSFPLICVPIWSGSLSRVFLNFCFSRGLWLWLCLCGKKKKNGHEIWSFPWWVELSHVESGSGGLVRTLELNCLWSMAFRYVIGWVPAPLL